MNNENPYTTRDGKDVNWNLCQKNSALRRGYFLLQLVQNYDKKVDQTS